MITLINTSGQRKILDGTGLVTYSESENNTLYLRPRTDDGMRMIVTYDETTITRVDIFHRNGFRGGYEQLVNRVIGDRPQDWRKE